MAAGTGKAVDETGGQVIDPTENVKALSEASNVRQDDLRAAFEKYVAASILHLKEISDLRAEHDREMRAAEANRLDSIRQVDVLAVSTAAERSAAAIQTLATTTAVNAENLRNALTATATTIANQTSATVAGITERLTALERSSYEGKGKSLVADPALEQLVTEMRRLTQARDTSSGSSAAMGLLWAFAGAIVVAIVGSIVLVIAENMKAPATPPVIYAPAAPVGVKP